MEVFSELFQEELIFIHFDCGNRDDFFNKISDVLIQKQLVKESFKEAIIRRENKYPTGLRTIPYHVATPHTDPENVIEPFIAVIIPENPIEFFEMGTDDQKVDVSALFLLGIHKASCQVLLLQKMTEMFMDEEKMSRLLKEASESNMIHLLKSYIA